MTPAALADELERLATDVGIESAASYFIDNLRPIIAALRSTDALAVPRETCPQCIQNSNNRQQGVYGYVSCPTHEAAQAVPREPTVEDAIETAQRIHDFNPHYAQKTLPSWVIERLLRAARDKLVMT